MRRLTLWIFAAVVVVILFFVLCTFVRRPYETVLLNRFGHVIEPQQQARIIYNWYFKLPTDTVVRIDNRLHLWPAGTAANPALIIQVNTAGSETIVVRPYAGWRIVDPLKFYLTTGGSDVQAERIMGQKLTGLVQAELSSHHIDEIFNVDESKVHTPEIESTIAKEASVGTPDGKIRGLDDQGIQIVQVGFARMAFPPSIAQAVFDRMATERAVQAARYIADGNSQQLAIQGQAAEQVSATLADAQKQSETIKGDADRQALEILAKVQQSPAQREFYQYWKSIEFAKGALTKNTYIVIPTDSPILRVLFNIPTPTTQPAGGVGAGPAAGAPIDPAKLLQPGSTAH